MKNLSLTVLFFGASFMLSAQCLQHRSSSLSQPISIMGAHVHQKGSFMASFQSGFMNMQGMRESTNPLSESELNNRYMMYGKEMNMSMHMLMAMYGVTDRFNLMIMGHYMSCNMTMNHNMGSMQHEMSSHINGFGDTRISGLYELVSLENSSVIAQFGISLPTGSIENKSNMSNNPHAKLGYAMQFGSGTLDYFSSLSFTKSLPTYSFGVQGFGLLRNRVNSQGYTLGNQMNVNAWFGKMFFEGFVSGLSLNTQSFGSVSGLDQEMNQMTPSGNPQNTGFKRAAASIYIGYSPSFCKKVSLNGDLGMPIYENVEGAQMSFKYTANIGIKVSI
jgi:hypothetical protein